MLVSSPRCSWKGRRRRRGDGDGGIEHGGARPEKKGAMEFSSFRPTQQAAVGFGVERSTADPTVASEWREEAAFGGGDGSRRT